MIDNLHGRGAQINTHNKFLKNELTDEHIEGIDEEIITESPRTQHYFETPKSIVNKVESPDIPLTHSINPYQGCEHGCAYCYARNTHEYWGFSAGIDFESKIVVKKNAPGLLENFLLKPAWAASPIALSGNTDCYQPAERKYRITRALLDVFRRYQHPVGVITKNSLITRDLDLLTELAADGLVHVYFSITTLDEQLRRVLEPRTATASMKLRAIETLSKLGVPVGIMNAPIIPGLNEQEIPEVVKLAADAGARSAGFTVVRLNGAVGTIFHAWLYKYFPDQAAKVWNKVKAMHNGNVNDSEFGRRVRGSGPIADAIHMLFKSAKKKYMNGGSMPSYRLDKFSKSGTRSLF